jgi:IS5 family transposase
MFKALLLQQWYGLSDPGLEEAICDRLSFQRFLGLSLADPVPDETRICRFRNMLAQAGLGERLFALLDEQLQGKGLIVRRGSLIDATLIKAQTTRLPRESLTATPMRIGLAGAKTGTLAIKSTSRWTRAAT